MFDKKKIMQQTETAMKWIETTGFTGDLSDLSAGIYDISESAYKINELLPSLLNIDSNDRDAVLEFFVDLYWEMKHIEDHAKSAAENLDNISDFFAKNGKQ